MKRKISSSPIKAFAFIMVSMLVMGFVLTVLTPNAAAQEDESFIIQMEKRIEELMDEGDIPGLTLVLLRPDRPDYLKGFGYADKSNEIPVTTDTLFEIASCSKAFTALAALKVEADGLFNLDDPVTDHLPWFKPTFEGKQYPITLRQLLRHTSGIPFRSVGYIPLEGARQGAIEDAVKAIKDIDLQSFPGTEYSYATINYDVVALVMEKVTGQTYVEYMDKQIFAPLGLTATTVGMERVPESMQQHISKGHKIGFFAARPYDAPAYRGNWPAGYVVTNGKDLARWLKLQMGILENPLASLIAVSHQRDKTVPPTPDMMDMSIFATYAYGWQVSLSGDGNIYHAGDNPNFKAFYMFNPTTKTAVAVMTNSDNNNYASYISRDIMDRVIHGIDIKPKSTPGAGMDKGASVVLIILVLYFLVVLGYLLSIVLDLVKGRRQFEGINLKKIVKMLAAIPLMAPFLVGIYILPKALGGVPWSTTLVWTPISFKYAILGIVWAFGFSYLAFVVSQIFPQKNKYLRSIPMLIVLSVMSGGANSVIIFLISGSLYMQTGILYMVYYYILAMLLYVVGRKVIQTRLTEISFEIVYDMRMKLVDKIFNTSYQRFEKMDRGRVFSTLNDDTNQVGNSANLVVMLLTSIITTIGCFVFLATIAFWATAVTIGVIIAIATIYSTVSGKAQKFLEEARDSRDDYMRQLNGLLDGFKELSINVRKKNEYQGDVEVVTDTFRTKSTVGMVKFLNAFMVGESMLVAVLGAVGFAIPRLFPDIQTFTLMSFIMVLLYLIGPINGILSSIPGMMQLSIAWNRVKGFQKDIPANLTSEEMAKLETGIKDVEKLEAKGVVFEYESEEDDKPFAVGPVDFEAKKGEIVFIIGGNGSGKTTLAKLLTGLYIPDKGQLYVDGKEVNNYQLGEYFSTVYSNFHLFEKLYNIDVDSKKAVAQEYLKVLRLDQKVNMEADSFSTIDLSGGQRKRLALLQCYLEDSPIYLFDELAADQDPEFRKFFYRELLLKMKEEGKIVIAITHDDHYFDVADKVVKLDMGKVDVITEGKTRLALTS